MAVNVLALNCWHLQFMLEHVHNLEGRVVGVVGLGIWMAWRGGGSTLKDRDWVCKWDCMATTWH